MKIVLGILLFGIALGAMAYQARRNWGAVLDSDRRKWESRRKRPPSDDL